MASNLHRGAIVRPAEDGGEGGNAPLRVGVLLGGSRQPAWLAELIDRLGATARIELSLYLAPLSPRSESWYSSLERLLTRGKGELSLADLTARRLQDAASIPRAGLDVLLSFGADAPPRVARFGTWSCECGTPGDAEPGAREYVSRSPTMAGRVSRVDDGALLASVNVAMNPVSPRRATVAVGKKLAARIELLLHQALERPLSIRGSATAPAATPGRIAVSPLRVAAAAGALAIGHVREKVTRDHWFIAYDFGDAGVAAASRLGRFRRLVPPADRLWADPFPVQRGERSYLFFEELVYQEGRGVLAVCELFRDGRVSTPQRIVERPYHLSYPNVFRWNGGEYMVPESGANRTVELFRAVDFPLRWESAAILFEGFDAADPTLFEYGGLWWIFFSRNPAGRAYDELHAWYADSPLGPWKPHALNPLLNDVTAARCGGAPFLDGGRVIRAVQDGARGYGHTIRLREIVTLTPDAWEEREVAVIPPRWAPRLAGTHTFNVAGDLTAVDGYWWRLRI